MDKEIKIRCKAAGVIDINDLEFFQGDLKTLSKENYERLRSRILQRGFSFPFFVWVENGTNWILDGHHRYLILQDLRALGYHVPPLPVAYIEADTLQEAKAKLLELNSNYAKIDASGYLTFTVDLDMDELSKHIDLPDFHIPNIEIESLEPEDLSDKNKEIDTDNFGNDLQHTCPKCGFEFNE